MPTYEFVCNDCKEEFEMVIPLTHWIFDDIYCPKCYGKSIRRVWDIAGIIFKGKGFYVNDSKGEK